MISIYRLLIVDDEEIIVNGLAEILSSIDALDLDIYKAYSGKEALEWLNRTRFDIVLSDIRMPEINGLQLMKEILKTWPQCKIVFLTGYNEFDYVYEAIQHKNIYYLLKTEDSEKVIDTIKETIQEIDKEVKIEDLIHQAKNQMSLTKELYQKEYLMHLLHDTDITENNNMQQEFRDFSIRLFPARPVLLMVGQLTNLSSELTYTDKIQYMNSVKLVISQNLKMSVQHMVVVDADHDIVVFIQPNMLFTGTEPVDELAYDDAYKKTALFVRGTLEVIQTTCERSVNAAISFALCEDICQWQQVSTLYSRLKISLRRRKKLDIDMIISIKNADNSDQPTWAGSSHELKAAQDNNNLIIRRKCFDQLESYLESGEKENFYKVFNEMTAALKNTNELHNQYAAIVYFQLVLVLFSHIQANGLTDKVALPIEGSALFNLDMFKSWDEAIHLLHTLSDNIFKLQAEVDLDQVNSIVASINSYIKDNLSSHISLVTLGEMFYLNPSYLSRLYKHETGQNLSAYIDKVKIRKAKELLANETHKIYEVAKAVGYDTPASFTRFFKNRTGYSPQEYIDSVRQH